MKEQTDKQTKEQTDIEFKMNEWTNKETKGQVDKRTKRQKVRQTRRLLLICLLRDRCDFSWLVNKNKIVKNKNKNLFLFSNI